MIHIKTLQKVYRNLSNWPAAQYSVEQMILHERLRRRQIKIYTRRGFAHVGLLVGVWVLLVGIIIVGTTPA